MVEADNKEQVHEYGIVGSFSPSSSSSSVSGISNGSSLESDSFGEVSSHASSAPSSVDKLTADPLNDMSSLFQQLPIKRGLSMYYQGKSESFTSLANVSNLEDLVKPENPYNKKLKSCRSYGGGLAETHRAKCTPCAISRHVSKRGLHSAGSRGSCSSLSAKRGSASFVGARPPIPPHRSTSTSTIPNQTALFV